MERVFIKDTGLSYDYSELETRKETSLVVIHHTGNPTDDDLSAQEINRGHQAQGWVCIGYHYVIRKDGTIELGRPHWTVGAHAYGFNDRSIGIHLCGNFEIGTPTPAQIESVSMLLANICTDYGLPITSDHVVGHRDLMPTACPGQNLYDILQTIRGKAIFYQNQRGDNMEHKLEVRSDLEELLEAVEYCAKVHMADDGEHGCANCPTGADYKLCGVALGTVDSMLAIGRLGGCKWEAIDNEPV